MIYEIVSTCVCAPASYTNYAICNVISKLTLVDVHSLWGSVCVGYFAPCRYTSTRDIFFIVYFIYYPLLLTFFPFFLPQWNHISPSRRACRETGDNSSFIIIPFLSTFFPFFLPQWNQIRPSHLWEMYQDACRAEGDHSRDHWDRREVWTRLADHYWWVLQTYAGSR